MATLGTISVDLHANISQFNSQLGLAKGAVTQFAKHVNTKLSSIKPLTAGMMIDPKATQGLNQQMIGILKGMAKTNKGFYDFAMYGGKAKVSAEQLGQGLNNVLNPSFAKTGKAAEKGTATVTKSFKNMNQNSLAYMLSLQNMMKKIIHYITFSIGVQMVMGVKKGFQDMIETFKTFERAATNATTVSGHLGYSFERVREGIMAISKELGKETIFSASQVIEAYYDLASAGYDIANMTKKDLVPILNYAAATQSELKDATYATATALKAFRMDISETEVVVDSFTAAITSSFMTFKKMQEFMKYVAPLAGELGLSLQETIAAGIQLTDVGMEGSQAGQRLNMVLTKLLKPTENTKEMLAGMGLTMEDLNPEVYSLTEILYKLKAAGFGAAEAATMFRARTAASATVLVNAVDEISRYNSMLLLSEGITQRVAAMQENTLFGAFQRMSNAINEAFITLGDKLAPQLEHITEVITSNVIPALVSFTDKFFSLLPLILRSLSMYLKLKLILFVITKAYKLYLLLQKAGLIIQALRNKQLSITAGLMNMLTPLTISAGGATAGFSTVTGAAIPVTQGWAASLWSAATPLNILTFGAAAAAAAISFLALSSLGVFDTIDALGGLADVTSDLKIGEFYPEGLTDAINQMELWEVAMLEHSRSSKTFLESMSMITDAFYSAREAGDVPEWRGLTQIDQDFQGGIADVIATAQTIDADVAAGFDEGMTVWGMKVAKSILDFQKASDKGDILGQIWEGITVPWDFAMAGIAKLFPDIEGVMKEYDITEYTGSMKEAFRESFAAITNMTWDVAEQMIEYKYIVHLLSNEYSDLKFAAKEYEDGMKELEDAQTKLDEVTKEYAGDVTKLVEAEENLRRAEEKVSRGTQLMISAIGDLMTETRRYNYTVDETIQLIEEYFNAERELLHTKQEVEEATRNEADASMELSEAIIQYGSSSNEAANAQARLWKASANTVEMQERIMDLQQKLTMAQQKYESAMALGPEVEKTYNELRDMGYENADIMKMIAGYSEETREAFIPDAGEDSTTALKVRLEISDLDRKLIEQGFDLAEIREKVVRLTAEQSILYAKEAAYMMIQDNYLKYINEKLKIYFEKQKKIYDIEEKLYKLRNSEKDQFDDLFQSLAEQGLVNDDLIGMYKEMKMAEGDVLKNNKALMDVYGELQKGERDLVEQYLNGDISLAELNSRLAEYYATSEDTTQITSDQMDVIMDARTAYDRLRDAVYDFGSSFGPVMQDLIDANIVSAETAKIWFDIADNAYELALETINLDLALGDVSESIRGVVHNSMMLAKSLMDENIAVSSSNRAVGEHGEAIADLFDVYEKGENAGKRVIDVFLDQMGVWDAMGGDINSVKDTLVSFFEVSDFSEITDEMIVTAAGLIQLGEAGRLWEEGMTATQLITELNGQTLNTYQHAVESVWDDELAMIDVTEDLTEVNKSLTTAVSDLEEVFSTFITTFAGVDPLITALQTSFSEIFEGMQFEGDLETLFDTLENKIDEYQWEQFGVEVPLNLDFSTALMKSWTEQDWQSFTNAIKSTNFGNMIGNTIKEATGGEIDFWDPKMGDWKNVRDKLLNSSREIVDAVNASFEYHQTTIPIRDVWGSKELDWDMWLSELGGYGGQIKTVLDNFIAEVGITDKWGPGGKYETFDEWMNNLTSVQMGVLMARLESNEIGLPIALDEIARNELYSDLNDLAMYEIPDKLISVGFDDSGMDLDLSPYVEPVEDAKPREKDRGWWGAVTDFVDTMGKGLDSIMKGTDPLHILGGFRPATPIMSTAPVAPGITPAVGSRVGGDIDISSTVVDPLTSATQANIAAETAATQTQSNALINAGSQASTRFTSGVNTATATMTPKFTGFGNIIATSATSLGGTVTSTGISFKSGVLGATSLFGSKTGNSAQNFYSSVVLASSIFYNSAVEASKKISAACKTSGGGSKSGIFGLGFGIFQKGGVISSPTMSVMGEEGAEAIIPLTGGDRRYGMEILKTIIPKYYPELTSGGGMYGDITDNSIGSTNNEENYNILGTVNVNATNAMDIGKELRTFMKRQERNTI